LRRLLAAEGTISSGMMIVIIIIVVVTVLISVSIEILELMSDIPERIIET